MIQIDHLNVVLQQKYYRKLTHLYFDLVTLRRSHFGSMTLMHSHFGSTTLRYSHFDSAMLRHSRFGLRKLRRSRFELMKLKYLYSDSTTLKLIENCILKYFHHKLLDYHY
ncbi:hypothetical protein GIX73_07175 [Lactobacillus reuteri]|uniref:Uncharacterized protein n=2 Tax=Limosilactobacillus reuteri TaxID=1598 RepID=A0A6A8DLV2_LIMRT|nr:hypothetical protein [Limosilactobacillus reuteri]MRI03997.1 hypothetical protein [Limosilactobacillus reuteri]